MPTTGDLIYASHFNNQTYTNVVTELPKANTDGTPNSYYYFGNVWYGLYGFPGRIRTMSGYYNYKNPNINRYSLTIYRMENGSWYNVLSFTVNTTPYGYTEYDIPIHQMTPDFYKLKILIYSYSHPNIQLENNEIIKVYPYSGNTSSSQYNLSWLSGFNIKRTSNGYSQQLVMQNPPDISNNYSGSTITFEQFGAYYGW